MRHSGVEFGGGLCAKEGTWKLRLCCSWRKVSRGWGFWATKKWHSGVGGRMGPRIREDKGKGGKDGSPSLETFA